ncbi:hypothetical protein [Methylobacterium segetis]|uniref:hypothetical protein n=1 Tax=Methylobacterium segetis TaxID=2488750 RepID=UPI00105330B1|nr:hypothetical protein [Methylobacterium segetis]
MMSGGKSARSPPQIGSAGTLTGLPSSRLAGGNISRGLVQSARRNFALGAVTDASGITGIDRRL